MSDDRTLGERIVPDPAVSLCTGTPRLPLPPVDVQPATVPAPPPAGDALAALAKERDDAKALWLHATADRDRYHKLAAEILGHLHEQPGGAHSARVGKVQVAKWREALAPLGGQS